MKGVTLAKVALAGTFSWRPTVRIHSSEAKLVFRSPVWWGQGEVKTQKWTVVFFGGEGGVDVLRMVGEGESEQSNQQW